MIETRKELTEGFERMIIIKSNEELMLTATELSFVSGQLMFEDVVLLP